MVADLRLLYMYQLLSRPLCELTLKVSPDTPHVENSTVPLGKQTQTPPDVEIKAARDAASSRRASS